MDGVVSRSVFTGGLIEADGCTKAVIHVPSKLDVEQLTAIRSSERAVLVFGPGAFAADVTASLDALAPLTVTAIVLTTKDQLPDFQELIDSDRIFYLSCGELPARELDALIDSALAQKQLNAAPDRFLGAVNLRRIAIAQSVNELADALRFAAANTVDAERTRCVLFDRGSNALWIPGESDGESTAVGLVSFILRTGTTVCVPRLGDDVRFDLDLDGEPSDRLVGVPVVANASPVAVLVATRNAQQPAFEPVDVAAMEALAAHASPYVAAWLIEPEIDGPFRYGALREQQQAQNAPRDPLQLDPVWMQRATWLSISALVALLLAFALWKGLS